MLRLLSGFLPFFLCLAVLNSCGTKTEVTEIKDFKLFIMDSDPEIQDRMGRLIQEFNGELGFQALSFVDNEYDANSPIFITDNIYDETNHHVGWGQWIAETHETKQVSITSATKIKRKVHYRMRIEFDRNYFLRRMHAEEGTPESYDLKKLFAHEVGHGMKMEHNEGDARDVMYPNIGGTKDFDTYYSQVRSFYGI
jgi:hypothetical protein